MKRYGLIVADNGSDMYISGTMDARWNNDVLNPGVPGADRRRLRSRPARMAGNRQRTRASAAPMRRACGSMPVTRGRPMP